MKVLAFSKATEQHRKEHIEQEFNPATTIPKVEEVEIKPKPYKLLIDYGKPMEEDYSTREQVKKRIKEILKEHEDCPYLDIMVIKDNIEITYEIMVED